MHLVASALLLTTLAGSPSGASEATAAAAGTRCVRVAVLTDLHGCLAGLRAAVPIVSSLRATSAGAGQAFLLLDGGDTYWIRKRHLRRGDDPERAAREVARSLEALGVAAAAYGNHDDDGGPRPRTTFPVLPASAGSRDAGTVTVETSNGLRIGVVGLARYTPLEVASAALSAAIAEGDDAVVVLAHSELAPAALAGIMRSPASLLLVGHHHLPGPPAVTRDGVTILRPAPGAGSLESALLCVAGGELTVSDPRSEPVPPAGCPEDSRRRR